MRSSCRSSSGGRSIRKAWFRRQLGFAGGVVALGASLVFGAGLVSYARRQALVPLLLIMPVASLAAVVIGLGHHLWPRFFFFAIGFAVLIVVRGAMVWGILGARLLRLPARATPAVGTALCVLLTLASAASLPAAYRPKQDYAGALSFVETNRQPGDLVVTVGLASFPYSALYQTGWPKVESVEALAGVRAQSARTWVLYTLPDHMQAVYPELLATVRRDFTLVRRFDGTLNGGAVFVYRAERGPSPSAERR
jgi:hypothetical protein